MSILDVLEDYNGTVHRMSESRFSLTFWFALPERDGAGELKTVFFADATNCNRFAAEQAHDSFKPTVYNLGKPQYDEQFNFASYGVISTDLREAFKHRLLHPTRPVLKGKILTRSEINERIKQGLVVVMVQRDYDGQEVCFFTDNHIFGYTILPSDFVATSFNSPIRVSTDVVEAGYITSVDEFLAAYGANKKILWDINGLLDELNIPEE